jgi:hypothetical protein
MAGGLKSSLSNVSAPSAPGGLGLSDSGCFPSMSVKQRVTYFGYSFIGGNVCISLVCYSLSLLQPGHSCICHPRLIARRGNCRKSHAPSLAQAFVMFTIPALFAMLITLGNLGFIVA